MMRFNEINYFVNDFMSKVTKFNIQNYNLT